MWMKLHCNTKVVLYTVNVRNLMFVYVWLFVCLFVSFFLSFFLCLFVCLLCIYLHPNWSRKSSTLVHQDAVFVQEFANLAWAFASTETSSGQMVPGCG